MTLLDGKAVSAEIRSELARRSGEFAARYGRRPSLAVLLIGNDPASEIYTRNKIKGCEEAGIRSLSYRLPARRAFKSSACPPPVSFARSLPKRT